MPDNENDDIERVIQLLETMMKTQDKIHEEKFYANHREVWKLRDEIYTPARNELKSLLSDLIKNKVDAD